MKHLIVIAVALLIAQSSVFGQKKQQPVSTQLYGNTEKVTVLTVQFEKGKAHNHPLMALWLADENGKYIQTLYVAESIAKGYFKRANHTTGMWEAGEIQRPATLPYWAHQRGVKNEYGTYMPTKQLPVPDAYTGATPIGSFVFHLITDTKLCGKYNVYMEINQSWDWNDYWHNAKFPDDKEYKTSSQPALVYEAKINSAEPYKVVDFKLIGHSHYSGKNGQLYTDINTLTTALNIVKKCTVSIE